MSSQNLNVRFSANELSDLKTFEVDLVSIEFLILAWRRYHILHLHYAA